LSGFIQLAERIVGGVFVHIAEGGIVEDRVDEKVDVALEMQAGQADVNQFAGDFADDVRRPGACRWGLRISSFTMPSVSPMIWPRP
jgi:hypothetical protein